MSLILEKLVLLNLSTPHSDNAVSGTSKKIKVRLVERAWLELNHNVRRMLFYSWKQAGLFLSFLNAIEILLRQMNGVTSRSVVAMRSGAHQLTVSEWIILLLLPAPPDCFSSARRRRRACTGAAKARDSHGGAVSSGAKQSTELVTKEWGRVINYP